MIPLRKWNNGVTMLVHKDDFVGVTGSACYSVNA
jgi:hypothetical protein